PPVAPDYGHTTPEDTPVTGTVTSTGSNGHTMIYPDSRPPANGTDTIDPDTGAYTYTPDPDYNGPDEFTVTIDDGNGGTTTSVVKIGRASCRERVESTDDAHTRQNNTPVTGTATSTDIEGDTPT